MVDNFDLICEWLDNQRIDDVLDGTRDDGDVWYIQLLRRQSDDPMTDGIPDRHITATCTAVLLRTILFIHRISSWNSSMKSPRSATSSMFAHTCVLTSVITRTYLYAC